MTDPTVKNISQNDQQIELILSFPKTAIYFQGHFPETPILPGFVQVHYAMFFAKKTWKINSNLNNIKRLKFTKIITPEIDVILVLERAEKNRISFKYKDEKHVYSSGEFYLQEDQNV